MRGGPDTPGLPGSERPSPVPAAQPASVQGITPHRHPEKPSFPGVAIGILTFAGIAAWVAAGGTLPGPFRGVPESLDTSMATMRSAGLMPAMPAWLPAAGGVLLAVLSLLSALALVGYIRNSRRYRRQPEI